MVDPTPSKIEYPVSLPLQAVEEMLQDARLVHLFYSPDPRPYLRECLEEEPADQDWLIAALNCQNDRDILAVAIHTYLMDWRPK